jgi:hypothetical protein
MAKQSLFINHDAVNGDGDMDMRSGSGGRLGVSLQWTRTAAAYSILLLGLAGSLAAVPATLVAIVTNGLR